MLKATGVSFAYRKRREASVFVDLDWAVTPNETTLLLGPNGAGKSTLLKLLAGFEQPQRGEVSLDGQSGRRALYGGVGWMPQDVQPARGLTVIEQVEYVAWLSGLSRRVARERSRESVEAVDLAAQRDVRADRLSGGQLRRLGLAQTLVRQASVLLLDEPTAGLDPAQALNFRALIKRIDAPGGLVISTHQVDELATEVDRIVVLHQGRFMFDGPVAAFRALGVTDGSDHSLAQVFTELVGGGAH